MSATLGSTTSYIPQNNQVIFEVVNKMTLEGSKTTPTGECQCTFSATLSPKQLSDARIADLFARREKSDCKQGLKRNLELEIVAEQAFADTHPKELSNDEKRKIFVAEHMKTHEKDAAEYTGYDGDICNIFEESQIARKRAHTSTGGWSGRY